MKKLTVVELRVYDDKDVIIVGDGNINFTTKQQEV